MRNKNIVMLLMTLCLGIFVQAQESKESLSLDNYLNQVAKGNLEFIAEKYNVNIAEAEVIAAKVMPDPELQLEGGNDSYGIGLGYVLELGNKRGARIKLAKSQAELEKLSIEYFFQSLRAEAAEEYFNAVQQRELLSIKKDSYDYMQKIFSYDSIRYSLGEVNELDLRLSRLETSSLLNDLYDQEAAYKSALATVNQYMGRSTQASIELIDTWNFSEKDYTLSQLIELGLTNRVDLGMSKRAVEVAENQLKLTKAERKMDLELSVGYEQEWKEYFPKSKSIKGGINIPLMFSNRNKGAIDANKYEIERSKIERQSTELQVEKEISQAFFEFEAAKKKVKQYQTGLLEEAKNALFGIGYKYQQGESDITDVLVAQRTYNEFQEQYIESMNTYATSLINLQKSCGIWDIQIKN